jgi:hypothetical protein
MNEAVRRIAFGAGAFGLCALAASFWLCHGLAEVLPLPACDGLLGFTLHVVHLR